jgi:hypothetical protein
MKLSKSLDEYLIERNRSISKLKKVASQEQLYLREKQFGPLFGALKDIEKQHYKVDKRVAEAMDILTEIESVLEELKL